MYNVQDYSVLCNNAVLPVIFVTCGKHLHDCIISLSGKVWAPKKTSLTPPLLIEVPVPRQESEPSCICVLGVSILSLSTILIFDFGIVSYFFLSVDFYKNRSETQNLQKKYAT